MYPELEISLIQREASSYSVQLRLRNPQDEAEHRVDAGPVRFEIEELEALKLNQELYGKKLAGCLFSDIEVKQCFDKAKSMAQGIGQPLRLRLCIDRWSLDLHGLRWETLLDPDSGQSILTDKNLLFSRFLGSFDMRPVRLRAKGKLRVLVGVGSPNDLDQWSPNGESLQDIDHDTEIQMVKESLQGIEVVTTKDGRLTIDDRLSSVSWSIY